MMQAGFIPALGTPVDQNGVFLKDSYEKQINAMCNAGAIGFLVMGSMGMMASIRHDQYRQVVQTAIDVIGERGPILVGAMDNSVWRVRERVEMLRGLPIDGIVLTTPFYYAPTPAQVIRFYTDVANQCAHDVYMYDLWQVTQTKITIETVEAVAKATDRLKGIKTGDMTLARQLERSEVVSDGFSTIYSGLDTMDIAYHWGITTYLDGMFTCTPRLTAKFDQALKMDDFEHASVYLDAILNLRNDMVKITVFNAYKYAMNILGFEGFHCPDYVYEDNQKDLEYVKTIMKKHGEID